MLRAGEKENIIPGEAEARFDLRLLPEEDSRGALSELKQFFNAKKKMLGVRAAMEVKVATPGYFTDPAHPFVRSMQKIVGRKPCATLGGNDGYFFARKGVPVVCFSTDSPPECRVHGADEWVSVEGMLEVKGLLERACAEWVEF
jgi:acetylornithine deacetylase/succinyl-diaminopimelate desuccinylase-like protein